MNIAYACNIFEDEMDGMFIVEGKDDETVRQELRYDGRAATACPWNQDFPRITSPSMAPTLPEGTERKWGREKQKNLKYSREFCEEALGLKELECGGGEVLYVDGLGPKAVAGLRKQLSMRPWEVLCRGHIFLPMLWGFRSDTNHYSWLSGQQGKR